jgi:hypothetical protein
MLGLSRLVACSCKRAPGPLRLDVTRRCPVTLDIIETLELVIIDTLLRDLVAACALWIGLQSMTAMLARSLAASVIIATSGAAMAQDTKSKDSKPPTVVVAGSDQFRIGPGGLGCTTQVIPEKGKSGNDPCVRLGSLKIGRPLSELQVELLEVSGFPRNSAFNARHYSSGANGSRTLLMPIVTETVAGGNVRLLTYLTVVVDKAGNVEMLQISGSPNATAEGFAFSTITLGTPQARVVDVLGLPAAVQDVPQNKSKLWSYDPFPFAIEIVDAKVVSVRVRRNTPADERPFVALPTLPN